MTVAEKLTRVAENCTRLRDAGKEAALEAFWDAFQQNGERTYYTLAFYGSHWTDELYQPRHVIRPTDAGQMYGVLCTITDTKVPIDLTRARVGNNYPFHGASSLRVIREVVVDGNTRLATDCFTQCTSLVELRFSGNLACDVDLQWSTKLSRNSIESVVNCARGAVADHQGNPTVTLSLAATVAAFGSVEAFEEYLNGEVGGNFAPYINLV